MKTTRLIRLAVAGLMGVAAVLGVTSLALADNGPHGGAAGFSATTDSCAGCHRAHTAKGSRLLITESSQALCMTCHGSSGGAQTNVVDGQMRTGGAGLKGGGFTNAFMDTGLTGAPSSNTTTSTHNWDASAQKAWGYGPLSSVSANYSSAVNLTCVNCHNPHGNGQYRILRQSPTGGDSASANVTMSDSMSPQHDYPIGAETIGAFIYPSADNRPTNLSDWCGKCHNRYVAGVNGGHTDSTDAVFHFRHATTGLTEVANCFECHVVHGTSATMGTYSGAVTLPDLTPGTGTSNSRLLTINNRGVCIKCHDGASLTNN
jgi:predicted CXXCH cytochrome family protein